MKRLLKYIVSIILILLSGYMLYRGLMNFVTPPKPATNNQQQTIENLQPTTNNKSAPTPAATPTPQAAVSEDGLMPLKIKTAEKEISLNVEIADSDQERAYGLMNRTSLAKDSGMIFVYDREFVMTFWMKNTLIPLDIIFLDKNKKIVSFETMPPCKKDPCPTYSSQLPAQYAIELNSGFVNDNGINIDNMTEFDLTNTR